MASVGGVFFFGNWWLLAVPLPLAAQSSLYIFSLVVGFLCLLAAGLWVSRLLKSKMLDDPFNIENESFMQETVLKTNEYSINLPTLFRYKGRQHEG